MAYTKNIAVINGVKDGFSADGGRLSGLIKAERYAGNLTVEVSLINFAPLTEGRYVCALSDGPHTQIIEGNIFCGPSQVDTGAGFAAVVCYVNNGVQLLASAVCGNFSSAVFGLKGEIERAEKVKAAPAAPAAADKYEDEAIAEVNYYEYGKTDEGGESVRQSRKEEAHGGELRADAEDAGDGQKESFYSRLKGEIDGIFAAYPPEERLCAAVENSRWAKISYGDGAYYVFGVISSGGEPKYLCYGIPARDPSSPPASMRGYAAYLFLPPDPGGCVGGEEGNMSEAAEEGADEQAEAGEEAGYWVMYQDAITGSAIANAKSI